MAPSPSRKCVRLLSLLELCEGDMVEVALRDGTRFYGKVVDVKEDAFVVQGYSVGSSYGTQGGRYLVIPSNVAYVRRISEE